MSLPPAPLMRHSEVYFIVKLSLLLPGEVTDIEGMKVHKLIVTDVCQQNPVLFAKEMCQKNTIGRVL